MPDQILAGAPPSVAASATQAKSATVYWGLKLPNTPRDFIFGYGSLIALGVLLVTGYALATHEDLWGSSTLQIKVTLVAAIIALTLAHLRWPKLHALQGAILLSTAVVIWLGLDLVV